MRFGLLGTTLLATLATPAMAQDLQSAPSTSGITVRAVHVPKGLTMDGRLDEEIYKQVEPISSFIQQEPQEGAPATEKTEVWVFFDDRNLYVSARMWDSHPEKMVVTEMRRDSSEIFQNETFTVTLDTFHDRRSGYYLMTNPLGALRDAQFTSETQSSADWDPIWNPRAQRFAQGWTVEFEIPFKSLRYPSAGEQIWGINFRRGVRWKNEISHLTRIPAAAGSQGVSRMSEAAMLVGVRTAAAGKNLEIKPYAISRVTTDRLATPAVSNDPDGDFGLDLKYGVTKGLTADFTYNTDFAQVEDDRQQVNLTRFGLFFPEKREFFLEGQTLFAFGGGAGPGFGSGTGDRPMLFFSRQIGLSHVPGTKTEPPRDVLVPIRGGGRLTGKIGRFSLGIVNIQTGASAAAAATSTNFGVVRVSRDILKKSSIGVIATQRTPEGRPENTAFGADASFLFGLTSINTYYAKTITPGRPGDDTSYFGSLNYNGDRYGLTAETLTVEPNFNPEIGFMRRQDFRKHNVSARFSPRPANMRMVRKFYYEGGIDYYTNNDNRLESRLASLSFRTELESQDTVSVAIKPEFQLLAAPFPIASTATIPPGEYTFQAITMSYHLGPRHRFRGDLGATTATFYDGTRREATYTGRVDLAKRLTVEPAISLNWVDLPWGNFTRHVISANTAFALSTRALTSALVQYNSSTRSLTSNIRFRWEYTPGSQLFVVYSEGRTTLVPDRFSELQTRTFVVKLTRLFRY